MEKEFNLSECISDEVDVKMVEELITVKDVKEFIKRLKENEFEGEIIISVDEFNKLIGEQLK